MIIGSVDKTAETQVVLELTIGFGVSGFSSGLAPHPVNAQIHNPTATNLLMFVFFIFVFHLSCSICPYCKSKPF